ncbi:DNA methyltransferase [Pantoea sp. NSTU24]|uniref:DNA methyltransferase n=1 Tax=Pantoea sp. NSTU24 TaxID=3391144 RepID=UPI003D093015
MKQKFARYEMHKYWGKKPSGDLLHLIEKYSNKGDLVFDPFAGYGVFVCEAYINGRNAIGNDLNPASVFIQEQLLEKNIDIDKFKNEINEIIKDLNYLNEQWFTGICPSCGKKADVIATLRGKDDSPLMNKVSCTCSKAAIEYKLEKSEVLKLKESEDNIVMPPHPCTELIRNGRISALDNMTTDSLFTKRTLICHISLFDRINSIENKLVRDFAMLVFTSNLANCSKLVPPINSRGPMAPGAWMTGFYIGNTYLENNVFHYFKNRVAKAIAGKLDFYQKNNHVSCITDLGKVADTKKFKNTTRGYLITQSDTKKLPFQDNSIDYIFTDPPYGDSVPYFEQSVIWNTWLQKEVDYSNEVVVTDAKVRNKRIEEFTDDINKCIKEIYRVLNPEKYFSITFHSISGGEWYAVTRACLEAGFTLHELKLLTQKTFSPRQLNRKMTIKGDILITFQKTKKRPTLTELGFDETIKLVKWKTQELLEKRPATTNEIFVHLLVHIFSNHILFHNVNFMSILLDNFAISEHGLWASKMTAA